MGSDLLTSPQRDVGGLLLKHADVRLPASSQPENMLKVRKEVSLSSFITLHTWDNKLKTSQVYEEHRYLERFEDHWAFMDMVQLRLKYLRCKKKKESARAL